jgi:ribose transport system permease protein
MSNARALLRTRPFAFAGALTLVLLVANVIADPRFGDPSNWAHDLAAFAPLALVAMASTPSIISGGGGLDLSIGPLAVLCNIVLVNELLPNGIDSAWAGILILLALGAVVGASNGFLVAVLRYQPFIATLCMFFIIGGLNLKIGSTPEIAKHNWTSGLADTVVGIPGAVFLLAIPVAIWLALRRVGFHRALYGVGGNDHAAFSAGVNVPATRAAAYALGGMFAAVAGIALTALVQSSQASQSSQYTLLALAAVALGGTQFSGGRGGLLGSTLGAASIYLIQTLLSATHVPASWLQVVYGGVLVVGVVVGALATSPRLKVAGR